MGSEEIPGGSSNRDIVIPEVFGMQNPSINLTGEGKILTLRVVGKVGQY